MQTSSFATDFSRFATPVQHFGGDQSPLNDADADEDNDPEGYLDLDILGLDDFVDADKLDPTITGDIGSSTLG
ncbi:MULTISPECIES: hypothetical protein [Pseudomonas]|uniref:Uncharacterized protein n=1 Tax=Pseudomonas cichorii TaxID=36746 RepID=A0ABQ1DHX1_PSECI|nr:MULTISPECIES: hypothetical protein [Pseudomonas]AHF67141.1 hypothetical protein PCH70_19880 [Pseudomonas cichorii JBC1]MBX8485704.1 hypothetical protein [Pseudomonas cichorii]MBX8495494.1 hypothetical protein [Pseudomonas cichorii]QVE19014.1 hypothetical protein KGD89_09920 [Pseudomonas cichorii]SDN58820.1 hypothetical protein SAMN05216599_102444 [Pseudomonas cichorii]